MILKGKQNKYQNIQDNTTRTNQTTPLPPILAILTSQGSKVALVQARLSSGSVSSLQGMLDLWFSASC